MAPQDSEERVFLRGKRGAPWDCHCGCHGNFSNRIKCRGCGRDAPANIKHRALQAELEADRKAGAQAGRQSRRPPPGQRGRGPGDDNRLGRLEAQVAKLVKGLEGNPSAKAGSGGAAAAAPAPAGPSDELEEAQAGPDLALEIEQREAALKQAKDAGWTFVDTGALERELGDLRKQRLLAKPAQAQRKSADHKIERAQKNLSKVQARIAEIDSATAAMAQERSELSQRVGDLTAEIAAQRRLLSNLVAQEAGAERTGEELLEQLVGLGPLPDPIRAAAGFANRCNELVAMATAMRAEIKAVAEREAPQTTPEAAPAPGEAQAKRAGAADLHPILSDDFEMDDAFLEGLGAVVGASSGPADDVASKRAAATEWLRTNVKRLRGTASSQQQPG